MRDTTTDGKIMAVRISQRLI
uniref:Uncharacterized protein n=1 Tax=Arundo donax TaxID=35708 RepID=A0A0A8YNA9_ARUDO